MMPVVEPAIGSTALKAALAVAKHLPKLAQSGRVKAEHRMAAYERFSSAVWSAVEGDSSTRSIQPIAAKIRGGFWYHPMFVRSAERTMVSHGELLGAYGALRLVAPNAIVSAAENACECIAELAATTVGDLDRHRDSQDAVGLAMVSFDLLSRIDLGVARHPSAPTLSWHNPGSWGRQLSWLWRVRRGEWPVLPASAVGPDGATRMSIAKQPFGGAGLN
jgi:hypothetical protein